MADQWRSCTPPGGGRPYFVNLRTSETAWALPRGVDRSNVREFSSADEDAIPEEKLVPVDELASGLPSAATAGTGIIRTDVDRGSSEVGSSLSVSTNLAAFIVAKHLEPSAVSTERQRPCAMSSFSILASHLFNSLGQPLHLPLHPAVGRGCCFPGFQDLQPALAWRRRQMATAGFTGSAESRTSYQYRTSVAAGSGHAHDACSDSSDDSDSGVAGASAGDEGSASFFENVLTLETTWEIPRAATQPLADRTSFDDAAAASAAVDDDVDGLWALPPAREIAALCNPLAMLGRPGVCAKVVASSEHGGAPAAVTAALSELGILPLGGAAAAALSAAEACTDVLAAAADPSCTAADRSRLAAALTAAVGLGEDASDATPLHAALARLHVIISATLQLGQLGSGSEGDGEAVFAAGGCDFGASHAALAPHLRKRLRNLLLQHSGGSAADGAGKLSVAHNGEAAWAALFSTADDAAPGASAPGWALVQLLARVARCPSVPPPTALIACQCLCALATAVDGRVLDRWIFPSVGCVQRKSGPGALSLGEAGSSSGSGGAAGRHSQSPGAPLKSVIDAVLRGLVACLTGPARWANGFSASASAAASSTTAASASVAAAAAGDDGGRLSAGALQAAVAAALQPAATVQRIAAAASWLRILECALQHAADRVISDAAALAHLSDGDRGAVASNVFSAAVQESSIPWADLTAALLACIGADESSATAASAAAASAAAASAAAASAAVAAAVAGGAGAGGAPAASSGAGTTAPRSRRGSSVSALLPCIGGSSASLLTPVAQCLAALHRLFEVAVYSGAGEAVAAGSVDDAKAGLASLPDTFGLVTPVVEEAAAAMVTRGCSVPGAGHSGVAPASAAAAGSVGRPTAGAVEAAAGASSASALTDCSGEPRLDSGGALVLPSGMRGALASALVSVLAAPPADAERRRRSRRLSRGPTPAASHASGAAATASPAGGNAAAVDAVFLPLLHSAADASRGVAVAAFAASSGQWRGQRLAASSLLCALLECPAATPSSLLYASDATCLVDVIMAELRDLPAADHARIAWLRLLKALLLRSQWHFHAGAAAAADNDDNPDKKYIAGPRGLGRYRVSDITAALSALSDGSAVAAGGMPEPVRSTASLVLEAAADVLL